MQTEIEEMLPPKLTKNQSIVTFAIIYKFGGYKEKGNKRGGNLKNGTLRISRFLLLAYLSFLHTYYYIAHMA